MPSTVVKDTESLHEALLSLARAEKRVALVPTMGALHEGHMSLIRSAMEYADEVVLTIFVNPKQFSQNEDFSSYPRVLEKDIEKMDKEGVSIVYAPSIENVYPADFSTIVSVGELGRILEGRTRPGHFDGVATVLTKMFLRVLPHVAVFGEKDYQQLCIVKRLISDLDIPVEIISVPTVREADGLAMSSRNAYLGVEERKVAPKLYETLTRTAEAIASGAPVKPAIDQGIAALAKANFNVDYLELRQEETLAEMDRLSAPARLLTAAWLGKTRLIDNVLIPA